MSAYVCIFMHISTIQASSILEFAPKKKRMSSLVFIKTLEKEAGKHAQYTKIKNKIPLQMPQVKRLD
jgi:hypothetical protein